MTLLLYVLLFIICIIITSTTKEPAEFSLLRDRYNKFINILPDKYDKLRNKSTLVCLLGKGELGYNINKGHEIAICHDKDVNSMFHVLLHELAHCTVEEYEHSDEFWKNTMELTKLAVDSGMYKAISTHKKFCGDTIRD